MSHKWTKAQHAKYRLTMQRKRERAKLVPQPIEAEPVSSQSASEAFFDKVWEAFSIHQKAQAIAFVMQKYLMK